MEARFSSEWGMLLGRKPYAKHWSWKSGISIYLNLLCRDAWLRMGISAFGLHILLLAFGYDTYMKKYSLAEQPEYAWFRLAVLGVFFIWNSRTPNPT